MVGIYIATYAVNPTEYFHSYLVLDEDDNLGCSEDQKIIRGGPEVEGLLPSGSIVYEAGLSSELSSDGLDNIRTQPTNSFLMNDRDENGVADTYTDRHYTAYPALNASLWTVMTAYAADLINISEPFEHQYSTLGLNQNSNSVINTILNLVSINMWTVLPTGFDWNDFTGINYYGL